jgi:uncharacterized membrane protein YhaH (DUF805 family)
MIASNNQGSAAQASDPVNFFSYQGRIGRGQYWIGLGICLIVLFAALTMLATAMKPTGGGAPFLAIPCMMLFFWIHSLFTIKRLRDMGWSGWYYLVFGIAPFALLALVLRYSGLISPIIAIVFLGLLALPGLIAGQSARNVEPRS